jgi:serine/threonine protein kinase
MPSAKLKPGFRLGKYEVLAHVATGGMSTVYKAVDTELRRTVALKVLPRPRAGHEPDLERFRREARLSARLSHKNIVTLFEYQYDAGHDLHYLALEFIDGIDLDQHIRRRGRLLPEEARLILIQAAKALDYACAHGVIHRDIKPANFLLARAGKRVIVKLTDLGLALVQGVDDFQVTRSGTTIGTLDYMSPEQARDSRGTDIRSDIYSLGCTGFHMLAGRPPFEGALGERVYKHLQEPPPDVRLFNPKVSATFWAVLEKMMAKAPEDRYQTPADLLEALKSTKAEASLKESSATHTALKSRRKTDVSRPPPPQAKTEVVGGRPSSGVVPSSLVTPEQARAAAVLHEKALQLLAEGGGVDYTRRMLADCLKLDPFNVAYHKTLRELNRKASGGVLGRLFGSLNVMALKTRLRRARAAGEYRTVLERGEEILARQPADVDTHLEMAAAAAAADLPDLAVWLLEQAREQAPDSVVLLRALARQYEQARDRQRAIAVWEAVQKLVGDDEEARKKINGLAVDDHIARRKYQR